MADYLGMGEETSFPQQLLNQQRQIAQIAQTRATTQHQLATTDYLGAMTRETENRARVAQLEFDANEKIAGLMSIAQEGQEEEVDPVTGLNTIAQTYIKSGLVKKGADILKTTAQITAQQATAAARQTAADAAKQKASMAMIEKYSSMLGGVEDQAGWDFIKQSMVEDDPQAQKWASKMGDYTPEKASALRAAMAKYKDKAWVENAEKRREIYKGVQEAREAQIRSKTAVDKEKLAIDQARERRLAKEGGDREARLKQSAEDKKNKPAGKPAAAAGMPTKAEIAVVEEQLKTLNVKGDPADHGEIAQEAKIRAKANPGLTQASAAAQVIQERIASGDITPATTKPRVDKLPILGNKTVPGQVFSKAKPATLPAKLEDAVKGQYYSTAKGVHKYLGDDKFEPVK
jgi:hypothetical protein